MNALDFVIIICLFGFFVSFRTLSFVYYALFSCGVFAGYTVGLTIALAVTKNVPSQLDKGYFTLGLMFGTAALLGVAGLYAGNKLRIKILPSRFYKPDKLVALPFKIVIVFSALVVLAQTLIYVPILSLQFEVQGSSTLTAVSKLFPSTPLSGLARKISPDQFRHLRLAYDSNPPSYNNLANVGSFQDVVNAVDSSVVKISGKMCIGIGFGSGFVVAPNLVVTNAHVIDGASSVYISDHSGSYPATPVLINNDYDIAVLYSRFIQDKPLAFSSQEAAAGSKAAILGYPAGGDLQLAQGVISGQIYNSSRDKLSANNTLAVSTTLGEGSSGSPVLNSSGEVIGVNDAGSSSGDSIAIRAAIVSSLINQAKHKFFPSSTDLCAVPPKFY